MADVWPPVNLQLVYCSIDSLFRFCATACPFVIGSVLLSPLAFAQTFDDDDLAALLDAGRAAIVDYPAAFFEQYEPDTALDMVEQVPGFLLDDGDSVRGFGAAAGNILINDRRPTAKQDPPSAILRRIPASIVERIELIRGQIAGLDVQGHPVLANVILHEDAPAAIRWDASLRKHSNVAPLRPEASISIAHRWNAIDYSAGLSGFRATFGDEGAERVYDGDGSLVEQRLDDAMVYNSTGNAYLNASMWLGETLLRLNGAIGYVDRDEELESRRIPEQDIDAARDEIFGDQFVTKDFELGIDAERGLGRHVAANALLLVYGSSQENLNDQRIIQADGSQSLYRLAEAKKETTEAIARLEFAWAGWKNHDVQVNFEVAYNLLDNVFMRTDDVGDGPVVVDVPGANTKVEEVRRDVLLQDTWTSNGWTVNYGLGAESSTISQAGDANQRRSFLFVKPQLQLTRSHSRSEQTRLRLLREVAQLDFNDFVSATVFLDDDLALGNPDLKPESTWIADLTHERRPGDLGVVSVGIFHHWISDVQDLLPITREFEAPGNIGDGRRWGMEFQSTIPMEWAGFGGARLDIAARWQDSSVMDPVTGVDRVLTAEGGFNGVPTSLPFTHETGYAYAVYFRQDLQDARTAWGWRVAERAERPRFKVNELDIFDEEDPIVDVFVETTRWFGIKIGFEINNVLDLTASRDRILYTGLRGLSGVDRRELQEYSVGRRYILYASGSY